jgi:hypothetical protein
MPEHPNIISAEVTLLLHRLTKAASEDRGLSLHRKEVVLAESLVALATDQNEPEAILRKLTELEDE